MFTSTDVAMVRHVVQRILVPCVVVIGLLGNSVSIYVLTRKRMRCTTNIYLTALAITDIAYLGMALLASLKHYEYVQLNCKPYYVWYGIMMWLIDACAYISIYIAVCFTIERFIAIRYPLKKQTFCTESLAKRVIAGVSLFCLLTTISTAFEHQYSIDIKLIDSHGKPCNLTQTATTNSTTTTGTKALHPDYGLQTWQSSYSDKLNESSRRASKPALEIEEDINSLAVKRNATLTQTHQEKRAMTSNIPGIALALHAQESLDIPLNVEFPGNGAVVDDAMNWIPIQDDPLMYGCFNVTYYKDSMSALGQNVLYRNVYFYFTLLVFVLIPLCVLGTFNCFLIMLVRQSKSVRGDLTNASSIRKSTKRKPPSSTVSQENRVTVTLIAVVLLFIICQLPWAIYLIVSEQIDIDINLQMIIGNIFNFLAAINAAANFFLYCVLSDKYRKTVRELITGYKYRKQRFNNNNNYNNTSLYIATSNGHSRRCRSTKTAAMNTSTMSTSSSLVIK